MEFLGRILKILPQDNIRTKARDKGIYRLVLQHSDFGLHNMIVSVEDEVVMLYKLKSECWMMNR